MIIHAVLRVRGPAVHIAIEGHPSLSHSGEGASVWSIAMDQKSFSFLVEGLRRAGAEFEVFLPSKSGNPVSRYDACQFCAFFDQLSENQCGATDWDFDTRRLVAATQDGQSSLGRCPEGHTVQ